MAITAHGSRGAGAERGQVRQDRWELTCLHTAYAVARRMARPRLGTGTRCQETRMQL